MARDPHQLAELDDDGNPDQYFRRYRYICRCGKVGAWQPSILTARGEHDVHRSGYCPDAQQHEVPSTTTNETNVLHVNCDDQPNEIIDKANGMLKRSQGLSFVDADALHDGYCLYELRTVSDEPTVNRTERGRALSRDRTQARDSLLHPKIAAAIQEIAAAICSGDVLEDPKSRAELRAYVERWARELARADGDAPPTTRGHLHGEED